jgi:hypothetical protein
MGTVLLDGAERLHDDRSIGDELAHLGRAQLGQQAGA